MPVYNVELFVSDAINSILKQTYKNIELIIVDDCSTDQTYSLCKMIASTDKRICLYRNEENMKIERTLNFALTKARGKYIARMDGDDISLPDRLQVMKQYLDDNADISLVGTNVYTLNKDGSRIGHTELPSSEKQVKEILNIQTPVLHIWMTYKKIYDELKGYRIFHGAEDYDFVLRTISLGYKVINIPNYYGYCVRLNRDDNTMARLGISRVRSAMYALKLFKERKKNGKDSYNEQALNKYIRCTKFSQKIYSLSNRYLYKAMVERKKNNYFLMTLFIFISLISTYQVSYYLKKIKYNILLRDGK